MKRKIIEIDEKLCNGCKQCVTACAEGAIQIVNGKAKLVADSYCDGLGVCVGHCPTGALKVIEREAESFNENLLQPPVCNCPSQQPKNLINSVLNNWPIQITLAPETADYYNNTAGLLIAADCVAFSCLNFHAKLVKGKTLLIGCPKLDDISFYTKKFASIFANNQIKNITVVRMDVPCCKHLTHIVKAAIILSRTSIDLKEIVIPFGQ
jgi:ferredoxin